MRERRGFTLIEVMVTVVIVGILAVLALVSYRGWVRHTHIAEATDMVGNIRAAQQTFYGENGAYLNVSNGLGPPNGYPLATPGKSATMWGAPCTTCPNQNNWLTLNVQPNAPVYFAYTSIAGDGVTVTPTGNVTNKWGVPSTQGQAINIGALSNGQPWYFVEADMNLSGDGTTWTHVYGMSGTNTIYVDGDGN
jgi:type IV pilus assembly protein PilE